MLTEAQRRYEDATSERVVFNCDGCGRETIIHVGSNSMLLEKRCGRCAGTDRVRPFMASGEKRGRIGTHMGRVKDPELRARRKAKSLRASRTRMGQPMRPSCADSEQGCGNHKHRKTSWKAPASKGKKF